LTCNLIGYPNEKIWPEFFQLDTSKKLLERVDNKYNNIPVKFAKYSNSCIELLSSMLTWDPKKRISVILHKYIYRQAKHFCMISLQNIHILNKRMK
jgi:hypothetical protein